MTKRILYSIQNIYDILYLTLKSRSDDRGWQQYSLFTEMAYALVKQQIRHFILLLLRDLVELRLLYDAVITIYPSNGILVLHGCCVVPSCCMLTQMEFNYK